MFLLCCGFVEYFKNHNLMNKIVDKLYENTKLSISNPPVYAPTRDSFGTDVNSKFFCPILILSGIFVDKSVG